MLWLTAAFGGAATVFCLLAMQDTWRRKGRAAHPMAVVWFFGIVGTYMACFTALRIAHLLALPTRPVFYAQTLAGASTVIPLTFIIVGLARSYAWGRVASAAAASAASSIVTLIFALGLDGPRADTWSIEYLPSSHLARWAVAAVYVVLPVCLSIIGVWAVQRSDEPAVRRRFVLFCASVALMFAPNAIRYVLFVDGPMGTLMAAIMCVGAAIGWRAYAKRDAAPAASPVPGDNG